MEYDKLIIKVYEVIAEGEKVLSSKYTYEEYGITTEVLVDDSLFHKWKVNSMSFLQYVFGDEGIHCIEFRDTCKYANYSDVEKGQAVLCAAKSDLEGGHLDKLEDLIVADVFDDFLDMAQHLLDQGFKNPAASLTGAVLEYGLRKMAKKNNVEIANNENIESLNQKIYEAQIYSMIISKNIHACGDIRNNADHAHFDEYSQTDVANMLKCVRGLLSKYLWSSHL